VNDEQLGEDSKVADFWDDHSTDTFIGETYWLANPIINRRYHSKSAGDRNFTTWVNFTVEHYLRERCPLDRVLSIGSGDGTLERHLASLNTALRIEGIDISPKRIQIACDEAAKYGLQNTIHYKLCNVETNPFPNTSYGAIYFNSSLHHMSDLDGILAKCVKALDEHGYLFINEYIGPNRFAFSEREKQAMQSVFQMIPDRFRISHADHDRGEVRKHLGFPDPAEVKRVDPSEAIHSEEIMEAVRRHFNIVEFNFCGGTLMQFLLDGIAGNFRESDAESLKVLDLIIRIEDTLVEIGDLTPHFAMIVATTKV